MVYVPTAEETQGYYRGDVAPLLTLEPVVATLTATPGDHASLTLELQNFDSNLALQGNGPHSLEACYDYLQRNLAVINRLFCGSIGKAHDIGRMFLTLPETHRQAAVTATFVSFRSTLSEVTQQLECSKLFSNPLAQDAANLNLQAAEWWATLTALGSPPFNGNDYDYTTFPAYGDLTTQFPDHHILLPLLSSSTLPIFYYNLGILGRMTLHHMLSCFDTMPVKRFITLLTRNLRGMPLALSIPALQTTQLLQDLHSASLPINNCLPRQYNLSCYLVAAAASLYAAFAVALEEQLEELPRHPHYQVASRQPALSQDAVSKGIDHIIVQADSCVTYLQQHTGGHERVLTFFPPVGNSFTPASTVPISQRDQIDAFKILSELLKGDTSQYKMPDVKSTQERWMEWFHRVHELPTLLPGVQPSVIITTLTTHIADSDRRVYGWREKVEHLSQQPTLDDFLSHIKSQVLTVTHTRQKAYKELLALQNNTRTVPDCIALATKFRQLFGQIFPNGETEETAPATKLKCCQSIHRTLLEMKHSPHTDKLSQAWRDHTGYDASATFSTYLKESLHTNGNTDALSEQYLILIETTLRTAHQQYAETTKYGFTGGKDLRAPSVAAFKPKYPRPPLAHQPRPFMPRFGGVGPSKFHPNYPKQNPKSTRYTGPPALGPVRPHPQPNVYQPYPRTRHNMPHNYGDKFASALDHLLFEDLRNDPEVASLIPPAPRDSIPNLQIRRPDITDWAGARAAIAEGACMLCLQGNHLPYFCNYKDKSPQVQRLLREYDLRGKRRKQELAAAAHRPRREPRNPPAPRPPAVG